MAFSSFHSRIASFPFNPVSLRNLALKCFWMIRKNFACLVAFVWVFRLLSINNKNSSSYRNTSSDKADKQEGFTFVELILHFRPVAVDVVK